MAFTAGAQSPSGESIKDADYKAEIVSPDGSRSPLALVHQGDQMVGSFRQTQAAGDYAIEVTATEKDHVLGTARARFTVFAQDLELDNAAADATAMESLAAMTDGRRARGGEASRVDPAACRADPRPASAAEDEEDLLGQVVVFPGLGRIVDGGVVFPKTMGIGIDRGLRLTGLFRPSWQAGVGSPSLGGKSRDAGVVYPSKWGQDGVNSIDHARFSPILFNERCDRGPLSLRERVRVRGIKGNAGHLDHAFPPPRPHPFPLPGG